MTTRRLTPALLLLTLALTAGLARPVRAEDKPLDIPLDEPVRKPIAIPVEKPAGSERTPAQQPLSASLLPNGDFEIDADADGKPDGWGLAKAVTWEKDEDGNRFLRITSLTPDKMFLVYRKITVPAGVKALQLNFNGRVRRLKRGSRTWYDARIIINIKDAAGKKIGSRAVSFSRSTGGWVKRTLGFLVPDGAATIDFMPCIFNAKSGTFDLDDMRLVPTDPAPIIEAKRVYEAKKAAEIAKRAARVKPQVPVAPKDKLPPMLHVDGNRLRDPDGNEVWLQGLCVDSLEWSAAGERILKSLGVAIKDWKANSIRLPVREHFYAGTGPWQGDGGALYRQTIEDAVNLCGANGVYLIIDLHRFHAPLQKDADFWTKVATKYKDHPAVIFELFNEPHDISWTVWRDGGFVARYPAKPGDKEKKVGFESIGMQKLVDAVRATGAKNVIIAGGIGWSYDISGIVKGFALDDRGGRGIMYSSHIYPWKTGWQSHILVTAEKYPVFIGEVGNLRKWEDFKFIPVAERNEKVGPDSPWPGDTIGMIQKYRLNWTAFSFHPRCGPMIISDWDYTPTPYWGVFVKRALAGEKFEMKKMR